MNKYIAWIVVVVIVVVAGVWLSRDGAPEPMDPPIIEYQGENQGVNVPVPQASTGEESTSTAPVVVGVPEKTVIERVQEIVVTGSSFKFDPKTIMVKKGDKVRIVFKNTQGFHDFVIDEFKVATKRLQGAGEDVVEFVADKTGSFEYYCSVGEHRAMGMKGMLVVE